VIRGQRADGTGIGVRVVLLGDPVAHSLSPVIHRAAFAALGIDGSYEARRVDSAGLATALDELRDGVLQGANVTMPHKSLAARECAHLDDDAAAAGAANTLAIREGEVHGWNTDVGAIRERLAGMPAGPVLVLGAGGAAAAALVAAEGRETVVAARRPDAARALAGSTATMGEWGLPVRGAIVINATPLGRDAEGLPERVVEAAAGLIDLAYGPSETPGVARMRRRRLPVADGVDILVAQAAASFTIWTGVEAPVEEMRAAVGR